MYSFSPIVFALDSLVLPTLLCLGFALVFAAALRAMSSEQGYWRIFGYYFVFTFPVALIAFLVGDLTGLSRSSALGAVLAAALSLLAGLMVYVFGSESRFKVVVGYSAFIFVFAMFVGVQTGSYQRDAGREGYLKYLSEQEFRIKSFRKNLGLPDDMPVWVAGQDSK
jgi:hypothetical protein